MLPLPAPTCTDTPAHPHTGRCRRPHQASMCPHSHLLPCSPGPLTSKLAVLTQSPTPEPPSPALGLVPSPTWLQQSLPREAWQGGGQPLWEASGGSRPCTSQAPGSARPGVLALCTPGPRRRVPESAVLQIHGSPRNAFGKDLFLNTKNAPPASCGNSTFCSPHSGLHVCRLLSVRLSVYLLRPIPGETQWEKGG